MLFTGRITADAAVRDVKGDKKVTGFTIAINDRYTTKAGEKRAFTTFVECSYWLNPGLAIYLKKGAVVEIAGRVEAQPWVNKDGEAKANLVCNVDKVRLFGAVNAEMKTGTEGKPKTKVKATANAAGDDDDMPF